jgi:hypothetical protein
MPNQQFQVPANRAPRRRGAMLRSDLVPPLSPRAGSEAVKAD